MNDAFTPPQTPPPALAHPHFPTTPCRPPFHPDEALDAWFGPRDDPQRRQTRRAWFMGGADFDATLRARFLPVWEAAVRGELAAWNATAQGRLALVIVLDQLSRNFFRGDARAFASDAAARRVAEAALAAGEDQCLAPVARAFSTCPSSTAKTPPIKPGPRPCLPRWPPPIRPWTAIWTTPGATGR